MIWFQTVVSAVSALAGGFIGGWVVAFRMGRWRQRVEDHLESIEARLQKGEGVVGNVPVLSTRVDLILEEVRSIRADLRRDRGSFVTHEECDRRHDGTDA